MQFYEEVPPPKQILIDRPVPEAELLAEALSERAERKVTLRVPQRGDHVRMVSQGKRNAEEELDRHLAETSTQAKTLRALTEIFELPAPPERIEGYDHRHGPGTHAPRARPRGRPPRFASGPGLRGGSGATPTGATGAPTRSAR